jgi:hypothetical protein
MAGMALSFWIRSESQTYFNIAVLILAYVLFGEVESLANEAPLSRLIGRSLRTAAFLTVLREWVSASVYPMNWLRLSATCWPPFASEPLPSTSSSAPEVVCGLQFRII